MKMNTCFWPNSHQHTRLSAWAHHGAWQSTLSPFDLRCCVRFRKSIINRNNAINWMFARFSGRSELLEKLLFCPAAYFLWAFNCCQKFVSNWKEENLHFQVKQPMYENKKSSKFKWELPFSTDNGCWIE